MQNISRMTRSWFPILTIVVAACGYRSSPSQPGTPEVKKLIVAPANDTLAVGKSVQLTATAYDAHGQVISGITISWTSSAPGVAAVDTRGLVKGLAAGNAQVSASATATSAATVTVVP